MAEPVNQYWALEALIPSAIGAIFELVNGINAIVRSHESPRIDESVSWHKWVLNPSLVRLLGRWNDLASMQGGHTRCISQNLCSESRVSCTEHLFPR